MSGCIKVRVYNVCLKIKNLCFFVITMQLMHKNITMQQIDKFLKRNQNKINERGVKQARWNKFVLVLS